MKTIVILCFTVIATTASLELPSNFKICKRLDPKLNECLQEAIKTAIEALANGQKDFKILPLEPMAVDKIKIGESDRSVSLKQEYRNVKIHGLTKQMQMFNSQVDLNKLIIYTEALNDQVTMYADCKVDGKVLLLPIRGDGQCHITLHDLSSKHEIHLETYQKKGETYIKVLKYDIKLFPKHVVFYLNDLFRDNPLGAQLNQFFNENADIVFKELKTSHEEIYSLIFSKIADNIFTRVPFNKLLPD